MAWPLSSQSPGRRAPSHADIHSLYLHGFLLKALWPTQAGGAEVAVAVGPSAGQSSSTLCL